MAEVEGVVKMDDKPLDQIQVEFWPTASGPRSVGVTDASGRFVLKTDDGRMTGAAVGNHKVVLRDTTVLGNKVLGRAGEDIDMSEGRKSRISVDYNFPEKSSISKEVVAGKKNEIEIEVSPSAN